MVDMIYNFIRVDLMGNTTLTGADNLALLLTWTCIVLIFFMFFKLVVWIFSSIQKVGRRGKYRN